MRRVLMSLLLLTAASAAITHSAFGQCGGDGGGLQIELPVDDGSGASNCPDAWGGNANNGPSPYINWSTPMLSNQLQIGGDYQRNGVSTAVFNNHVFFAY